MSILLGLTALAGAVAKIGSIIDNNSAKEQNEKANQIIETSKEYANQAKEECQNSIMALSYEKRDVLSGSINKFVKNFKKIKEVNFANNADLMEIENFRKNELVQMQTMVTEINELSVADTTSNVSGLALAGTVAASTFAKGAVTATLGAIAAPVFAISSIFSASEASANLEKANANLEKALEFKDECETYIFVANGIKERCDLFYTTIYCIDEYWFKDALKEMCKIINRKRVSCFIKNLKGEKIFTDEEMAGIAMTAKLAKLLKTLIDTNILQEDGKQVSEESEQVVEEIEQKLNDFTKAVDVSEEETQNAIEINKRNQDEFYKVKKDKKIFIYSKHKDGSLYFTSKAAAIFGWVMCGISTVWGLLLLIVNGFASFCVAIAAGIFVCPKLNPNFRMLWKSLICIALLLFACTIGLDSEVPDSQANEIYQALEPEYGETYLEPEFDELIENQ